MIEDLHVVYITLVQRSETFGNINWKKLLHKIYVHY